MMVNEFKRKWREYGTDKLNKIIELGEIQRIYAEKLKEAAYKEDDTDAQIEAWDLVELSEARIEAAIELLEEREA